ncbi:fatty acid desaturase family protein [Larkinella insperata]|uniref:Fatty acid desaturase family protein n=1 Tax=Larkinella insperata TaxID=332158 RepID=A0ABW3Q7G0_9BACT
MKALTDITDPTSVRKPRNWADHYLIRYLKDERDLPFLHLTGKITFILIPLSVLLYLPFISGWVWWAIAAAQFLINHIFFKGPFGLMLHCTSHRPLFNNPYKWLNHYLPWVITPFFGQTPETYFSHHIGMHHPENNQEEDDSSTMAYQRDSFRHFLRYFADFLFTGLVGLTSYLNRKKRRKLARRALVGELSYFALCLGLLFVNWQATVVVFILPFFISRFIMMLGNWTQHAFVDAKQPGNPYKNAITCINIKYNHKCWNDGYHIAHHERPSMHWTEYPTYFQETLPTYAQNKSLIFEGIGYPTIFYRLMTRQYDKLASDVVNVNGVFRDQQEVIALLRQRTQPILTTPKPSDLAVPAKLNY